MKKLMDLAEVDFALVVGIIITFCIVLVGIIFALIPFCIVGAIPVAIAYAIVKACWRFL